MPPLPLPRYAYGTWYKGNHSNDRTLVNLVIKTIVVMVALTEVDTVYVGFHVKCLILLSDLNKSGLCRRI